MNLDVLFSLWWCVEELEWWWWWCDEWTDCCCGVGCCCCCCFWSCCWTINTFCRICSCWIAASTQGGCKVEFSLKIIQLNCFPIFFFVLNKRLGFCTSSKVLFWFWPTLSEVLPWVSYFNWFCLCRVAHTPAKIKFPVFSLSFPCAR